MEPARRVGVLLPGSVLHRIVSRRPTYELAVEYALAAKRMSLEAVLFSPNGYNRRQKSVRGYVWRAGRWRAWRGALPRVIHNRILPSRQTARILNLLRHELGHGLFNPMVSRDKWDVWQYLAADDSLKAYLPPTWPLTVSMGRVLPKMVRQGGEMLIKPRQGSLGLGIVFIQPMRMAKGHARYRVISHNRASRVLGARGLVRFVEGLRRRRGYIVQQTIPLLTYRGRRFDIRVPVQRDGVGEWAVVTPTIKQATHHQYLTNIARGGEACSFHPVIETVFGTDRVAAIDEAVRHLSLSVARRLSKMGLNIADIGLDIGLDGSGKPWLLEVNFRDQRLVARRAGLHSIHAEQYHNPMHYASHLLKQSGRGRTKSRRVRA